MIKDQAARLITTYREHQSRRFLPLNRLTINRSAVKNNVKLLKNISPGCGLIPVLKANAYGHGIGKMAEILNGEDCDFVAVDGYFEAAQIRRVTKHRLLVLGYINPKNVPHLDTKHCSFVVQDVQSLEAFGRLKKPVKIHVELNTGMNRLGLKPKELDSYLKAFQKYGNLELEGVMTHLADADNPEDSTFTTTQVKLFDEGIQKIRRAGFTPGYAHIANTAGFSKVRSKYQNSARIGIGLYGINPLASSDPHHAELDDLQPVAQLQSTMIRIIDLLPGEAVSYNMTFKATKPTRVGVLPLGYYEGVPRELSNKGYVSSGNKMLPIVGRVCMNHTLIDLQDSGLKVGDEVVVISSNRHQANSVAQISAKSGLFSYNLLTNLNSTIRREIIY
jgi:alanine racemase